MSNPHAVNWNWKSTRFRDKCKLYRSTDKRMENKIRKLKRHIKRLPNDIQAQWELKRIMG